MERTNKMPDLGTPIQLAPTFCGDEYTDSRAYLKFNNAIERMSQPREVKTDEADVEYVCRNDAGSVYAVVIHHPDGTVDSDMLTKTKENAWKFYRSKFCFHPLFVNALIASIYGYAKPSETQVAKELVDNFRRKSKIIFNNDYMYMFRPGGVELARCITVDGQFTPSEAIDFIPFECFDRDDIKGFYGELMQSFALGKNFDIEKIPADFVVKVLKVAEARLKKKLRK